MGVSRAHWIATDVDYLLGSVIKQSLSEGFCCHTRLAYGMHSAVLLLELGNVTGRIRWESKLRQEDYVLPAQVIHIGHREARNTESLTREGHHVVSSSDRRIGLESRCDVLVVKPCLFVVGRTCGHYRHVRVVLILKWYTWVCSFEVVFTIAVANVPILRGCVLLSCYPGSKPWSMGIRLLGAGRSLSFMCTME